MSSAGDIFIVGPDGDADDLVGVRVVDADEDGSALRVALEYYTRQIRVIDYRYVDGKSVEIPFDMEEPHFDEIYCNQGVCKEWRRRHPYDLCPL